MSWNSLIDDSPIKILHLQSIFHCHGFCSWKARTAEGFCWNILKLCVFEISHGIQKISRAKWPESSSLFTRWRWKGQRWAEWKAQQLPTAETAHWSWSSPNLAVDEPAWSSQFFAGKSLVFWMDFNQTFPGPSDLPSPFFPISTWVEGSIQAIAQNGPHKLEERHQRRTVDDFPKGGQRHCEGEVDHQFVEHGEHSHSGAYGWTTVKLAMESPLNPITIQNPYDNPHEITIVAVEIGILWRQKFKWSPKHVGLPRRSGVSDPVAAETVSPALVNHGGGVMEK